MSNSVPDPRLEVPRKQVAAGLRVDRKPLADWNVLIGKAIDRALVLANVTKQEASYDMGYRDQSALSRWIAGTERAQFEKLFALDALRPWLPIALAEVAGGWETTISVRRSA